MNKDDELALRIAHDELSMWPDEKELLSLFRRLREAWTAQQEPVAWMYRDAPNILEEASNILSGKQELREPIIDELLGFASAIRSAFPPSTAALETEIRDGNWIDKDGACKLCDGEIPHGHTAECHLWKLEAEIAELKRQLEDSQQLFAALDNPMSPSWKQRAEAAESHLSAVAERVKEACANEAWHHLVNNGYNNTVTANIAAAAIRSLDVQQLLKEQP